MGMLSKGGKPVVICGPSRTKQSARKQTDINALVEKYKRTGQFAHTNKRAPFYGDVSGMLSYQDALGVVIKARETFEALPVRVRERFDYDPAKMVAFFSDPANLPEAIAKGWAVPRPSPEPQAVPKDSSAPSGASQPSGGAVDAPKAS